MLKLKGLLFITVKIIIKGKISLKHMMIEIRGVNLINFQNSRGCITRKHKEN